MSSLQSKIGKKQRKDTLRARRLELAEDVCKDLRRTITMRDCDRTQQDWTALLNRLQKWMKSAGQKIGYGEPKPLTQGEKR